MPKILVSDIVAQRLRIVVEVAAQGGDGQQGSSRGQHALSHLQSELETPLQPPSYAGKGAMYPEGTVVSHERLLEVASWASTLAGSSTSKAVKNEDGTGEAPDLALSSGTSKQKADSATKLAKQDVSLDSLSLDQLLRGAQVAIATRPKTERSSELIESLRKIELAQQEAEYNAMLASSYPTQNYGNVSARNARRYGAIGSIGDKSSSAARGTQLSEAEEWQEVRRQLGAIANVGLSVAAVVTAVWWAGGTAGPIWKTFVAMPIAILVAVAEIALYTRHWSNVQKRKTANASKLRVPPRVTRS